jgi:hypothetical protein
MNDIQVALSTAVALSAAMALVALAAGFALGRLTVPRHGGAVSQSVPTSKTTEPETEIPVAEQTPSSRLSNLLFQEFRKACEPILSSLNRGGFVSDETAKRGRQAIEDFKTAEYAFRSQCGRGTGNLGAARAVEMTNTYMGILVEVLKSIALRQDGKPEQYSTLSYLDQLEALLLKLEQIQTPGEARRVVDEGIGRPEQPSEAVAGRVGFPTPSAEHQ